MSICVCVHVPKNLSNCWNEYFLIKWTDVVDSLLEEAVDLKKDRRLQVAVEQPATILNLIARDGKK